MEKPPQPQKNKTQWATGTHGAGSGIYHCDFGATEGPGRERLSSKERPSSPTIPPYFPRGPERFFSGILYVAHLFHPPIQFLGVPGGAQGLER